MLCLPRRNMCTMHSVFESATKFPESRIRTRLATRIWLVSFLSRLWVEVTICTWRRLPIMLVSMIRLSGNTLFSYDVFYDTDHITIRTVIGVDGILPTLDLLKAGHADLYKRCSTLFSAVEGKSASSLTAPPTHELMTSNQSLTVTATSPPSFALPGRLTFRWVSWSGSLAIH
jgi:hypothetical protein